MNKRLIIVLFISFLFIGWGKTGHKIINEKALTSFPNEIDFLKTWSNILIEHASDADNRKSNDPSEGPKHYIDIDEYNDFINKHKIIEDFDSIITKYGITTVVDRGLLPWAIQITVDSLTSAFKRKEWYNAMLKAADLGHYVADAHMPLHITTNFNGQLTGQTGVHSKYESAMIDYHTSDFVYSGRQIEYVENISDYTFDFIYYNYKFVDSVLIADKTAKADAGGSYSSVYYQKLWLYTKNFTTDLFANASSRLAELIYTAWVNAGSPTITDLETNIAELEEFALNQNYPNPFNPTTTISFVIPNEVRNINDTRSTEYYSVLQNVTLKVYDILGREVATLVNEQKPAGNYEVTFDASKLSSGIYFYTLSAGSKNITKKMILLR